MATLTEYVSAVAAAARKVAGAAGLAAGGVAVAGRHGGGAEDNALTADLRRALRKPDEGGAGDSGRDAQRKAKAANEATSAHGPDRRPGVPSERQPANHGFAGRPLQKPVSAAKADPPVAQRPSARIEPEALRLQRPAVLSDGAEPRPPAARAREPLVGGDAGRGAGKKSVEVVVHAADDLTAVIAESDEVRHAILRTVAEVMREG